MSFLLMNRGKKIIKSSAKSVRMEMTRVMMRPQFFSLILSLFLEIEIASSFQQICIYEYIESLGFIWPDIQVQALL